MAGDGNGTERIFLRQTNGPSAPHRSERPMLTLPPVSQPQLEQGSSQQSINATEDYESARTSRPSSRASHDGLLRSSPNHFSTPPSSPPPSPSRPPLPTDEEDTGQGSSLTTPRQTMAPRDSRIPRRPVGSTINTRLDNLTYDGDPPTPGAEDTPFIRFAVDQLTRDEEVGGPRQYPSGVRQTSSGRDTALASTLAAYAPDVENTSSRETSGGYAPAQIIDTYHDQPESADRERFEQRPESRSAANIGTTSIRPPPSALINPTQRSYRPRVDSRQTQPIDTSQQRHSRLSQHDVFVPYDQEVPPLRFRPSLLRLPWLGAYLFLDVWVIIGLLFSGIYPDSRQGLYAYTQFGGGRYFLFRYMPPFFGAILLLWLFQIQIALQRMAPFIGLASLNSRARSQAPLLSYIPTNFLLPHFQYFRASQPIIGIVMVLFWLQIITVPLLASLYNVYNYSTGGAYDWRWTTVQGVNWTLFALFVLQAAAVLTLMIWLPQQRTGLKWDARSIGDIIALLDRSNVMSDYIGSEYFYSAKQFRARLADRCDRLGYWRTSRRPEETFHAIGEEGADTRRYSLEKGKIREKTPAEPPIEHSSFPPDTPNTALGTWEDVDLESGDEYDRVRSRYIPCYMRFPVALAWCILGVLLYVAFLVVSFVNSAVIHGFAPLATVAPTSEGFSAANFTYSFIPAVIAQLLFLCWLSVDYAHRRLQPYVNMSNSHGRGATASQSLLLDYPSRLPVSVTLDALVNKDFKVAWYSVVTLLAALLPVLGGGCFWAQFYITEQQVRVSVEKSGYYALCVFLALYAVTLPSVLIGLRKRRLPHACTTLAEQTSWLYQSNVLSERDRRGLLGRKSELVGRLMSAKTSRELTILSGSGSEGHFVFGRFVGRDGRTHMGIERFGWGESLPQQMPEAFRQREDSPRPGESSRPATPLQQPPTASGALQAQAFSPYAPASRGGAQLQEKMAAEYEHGGQMPMI